MRTDLPDDGGGRVSDLPEQATPGTFYSLAGVVPLALLASLIAAVVALVLLPVTHPGRNRFDDIVASEIPNYNKAGDYAVLGTWVIVFLALSAALVGANRARRRMVFVVQQLDVICGERAFLLTSIAIAIGATAWSHPGSRIAVTAVAFAVAVLPIISYRPWLGSATRSDLAVTVTVAVGGLLSGVTVISLATGGRAGTALSGATGRLVFLVATFGCSVAARLLASRPRLLGRVAGIAQIPLPLLLLGAGMSFVDRQGSLSTAPTAGWVTYMVAVAAVIGALLALRRVRRCWNHRLSASGALLTTTVVAVTAFLTLVPTAPSSLFLGDDFHVGENLIQWPQIVGFDASPFESFIPVPGLIGWAYGAVNAALGDTAVSYGRAVVVVWVLVAAVSAYLLSRLVGPVRALLLAPLGAVLTRTDLVSSDRFLFVVPSALVLLLPGLIARPLPWVVVWAALGAANVLLVPATGLGFLLASLPAVAVQIHSGVQRRPPNAAFLLPTGKSWTVGLSAVLALTVVLAAPMLLDALRSSAEQAHSNVVAWGLPLFREVDGLGGLASLLASYAMSFGAWWLGLPVAVAFVVTGFARRSEAAVGAGAALALATGLFVLAMSPYAFSRIDWGGGTRPHGVTLVAIGVLLPVALFLRASDRSLTRRERRGLTLLLIIPLALQGWPSKNLVQRAAFIYRVGAAELIHGERVGLPGLDSALVPEQRLKQQQGWVLPLSSIGLELDQVLDAGDTFLDLSNSQAIYQYARRAVPTPYGAFAYATTEEQQRRMLKPLEKDPPAVIVLPPASPTGVLNAPSLRAYRVTRWLFESNYKPVLGENGQKYLVRPDRLRAAVDGSLTPIPVAALDYDLISPGLADLPAAWGESFQSMAWRFVDHTPPAPSPPLTVGPPGSPALDVQLPVEDVVRPDFLLLDLECAPSGTAQLRVTWTDEQGFEHGTRISARQRNLVPLGAMASWVATPRLVNLRVHVEDSSCRDGSLSLAGLYRLVR